MAAETGAWAAGASAGTSGTWTKAGRGGWAAEENLVKLDKQDLGREIGLRNNPKNKVKLRFLMVRASKQEWKESSCHAVEWE